MMQNYTKKHIKNLKYKSIAIVNELLKICMTSS